jgi:predicted transcriptional regulator
MPGGPSIVFIAFKALCLCEDLSATERRVLAALIEHFNRKTTRCDPSIERIAVLLKVNRRTVIRAVNTLVRKHYVVRIRHGGLYHRNSYAPNWSFFSKITAGWKSRWDALSHSRGVPSASPLKRSDCHLSGGENVTQTSSLNHLHKTFAEKTLPQPINTRQHNFESPSPSGFSGPPRVPGRFNFTPSSREAASDSACRRWTTDLMKIVAGDERLMAAVNDAMTGQMIADATEAELRKRGDGIVSILPQLRHAFRGLGGSAK